MSSIIPIPSSYPNRNRTEFNGFTDYNYEIIETDSISWRGRRLYRIRAARDFRNGTRLIKEGDYGGWVQGYWNLKSDGWVFDNAKVYDFAYVYGDAYVAGDAEVYGNAVVYGNVAVMGYAQVYDHAYVRGQSKIDERVQVFGDAVICQRAWIRGKGQINSGVVTGDLILEDPG